jgi:hypothetical protein
MTNERENESKAREKTGERKKNFDASSLNLARYSVQLFTYVVVAFFWQLARAEMFIEC